MHIEIGRQPSPRAVSPAQRQEPAPPEGPGLVAEVAPWIGGSYAWGLMTALTTKGPARSKFQPFIVIGSITAGAAVARLAARAMVAADDNDALVAASGAGRGALTGAAVGATLAAAGTAGSTGALLKRGSIVGTAVGLAIGIAEAATDTYVL